MKTGSPLPVGVLSALIIGTTALVPSTSADEPDDLPTGWITASPGVVKLGSFPTLNWEVRYPSTIDDYIDIDPPGEIETKERLQMDIRVLGAGVTTSNSNGSNLKFIFTEAWFQRDGRKWEQLFAGDNWDVRQDRVVYSEVVSGGSSLRFGGRFWWSNRWSDFYSSNDGTSNVCVLTNGDEVPTTYPIATAPSVEDFIKPYLDAGGRVRIGPMDCIVMMELTHTEKQRNQLGYDLQDMVLLITFKPV